MGKPKLSSKTTSAKKKNVNAKWELSIYLNWNEKDEIGGDRPRITEYILDSKIMKSFDGAFDDNYFKMTINIQETIICEEFYFQSKKSINK